MGTWIRNFGYLLSRALVGFGFTVLGLQLFTGPPALGEYAWASFFFLMGLIVLAALAAMPVAPRPTLQELRDAYFGPANAARARAFFRLSWLVVTSAGMWLVLWVYVLAHTYLAMYASSVVTVFASCFSLGLALLLFSFVLRALSWWKSRANPQRE
jgi:hypothetical protein